MRPRLCCYVIAASIVTQVWHPASATEPLSFGVLSAPPYGMDLKDGVVGGSNRDIAELIAAKVGLTFNYRLEPLARLIRDLQVGNLDLMIMLPGANNEDYIIAKIMPNDTIVLPKPGASFSQYDDLKGKTIALLRGAIYDPRLAADDTITKYEVDTYAMGLRMTQAGRVDGMVGPDFGLYYQLRVAGMARSDFGPPLALNSRTLCLLGSKSISPELAATLRAAVDELRKDGSIVKATTKYVD